MIRGLVVSCQPVPGGPFDTVPSVLAFARAAAASGARGLRIEGAANVAAVVGALELPVIGLIKRDFDAYDVRITALLEDVAALCDAGAGIIAFDATRRTRPVPCADLVAAIHACGRLAMADCADLADAEAALACGADILGSTLSGYTGGAVPVLPDIALVRALAALGRPVVAEGRYNAPALAAEAVRAGADCVVVGSAITRPEYITTWFADAIAAAATDEVVLAYDIGGTKTQAALVRGGSVLALQEIATDRAVAGSGWIEALAAMAAPWHGQYRCCAAAVTGRVENGIWSALNRDVLDIPDGFQLAHRLAAALGCEVRAVNDAQAAAWGEYRFGAGQGQDMVFVTVSTGIGGGIVSGGRLLVGARGLAGSLGSLRVEAGTLESVASGTALARAAGALGKAPDARRVFAERDQAWAAELLDATARSLAAGLVSLQALVDPQRVVIGGGVGLADGFLDRLGTALSGYQPVFIPEFVPAKLGAQAGIIGAAALI
jgi:N-acetylmannosamine-6-phosphate 2-epimerase/N-acetylmannosamine kinase